MQTEAINAMRDVMREVLPTLQSKTIQSFEQKTDGMRGNLSPDKRHAYIFGGHATFTILSPSGTRFTYRVNKSEPKENQAPVYFVSVLTGMDNTSDYRYIGTVFATGFRTTAKSAFQITAPCVRAIAWFLTHITDTRIDMWHEGVCCRCGRMLTVPESIESGIGPTCANKD